MLIGVFPDPILTIREERFCVFLAFNFKAKIKVVYMGDVFLIFVFPGSALFYDPKDSVRCPTSNTIVIRGGACVVNFAGADSNVFVVLRMTYSKGYFPSSYRGKCHMLFFL